MEFCNCSMLHYSKPRGEPPWSCAECGKVIACEFCGADDEELRQPATQHHIDYVTCDKHEESAIDNVSSRVT